MRRDNNKACGNKGETDRYRKRKRADEIERGRRQADGRQRRVQVDANRIGKDSLQIGRQRDASSKLPLHLSSMLIDVHDGCDVISQRPWKYSKNYNDSEETPSAPPTDVGGEDDLGSTPRHRIILDGNTVPGSGDHRSIDVISLSH